MSPAEIRLMNEVLHGLYCWFASATSPRLVRLQLGSAPYPNSRLVHWTSVPTDPPIPAGHLDGTVAFDEGVVRLFCWRWEVTFAGRSHGWERVPVGPEEGFVILELSAADQVRLALGGVPPVPDLRPAVANVSAVLGSA